MENRAVTFPQTKTILDGVNVPDVTLDDIQAILNMRDAWKYLLGTLDETVTLDYICKLNSFIARNEALVWGELRTGQVSISGTDYSPPVPKQTDVSEKVCIILSDTNTSDTEKALELFAFGVRSQLFWGGNKRTSMTVANKILLSSGAGIFSIKDKHMDKFNDLLLEYYNTGNSEKLKGYIYENCIYGIEF